MANQFFRSGIAGIDGVNFDAGLRAHMQRVYNYMGGGLALTGIIAYVVAHTALAAIIFGSPLRWLVVLAPLGVVIYMGVRMQSMSASALKGWFFAYCTLIGISLSVLFLVYTNASIANAFFVTAATFGGMSLWGYTTKRDLTSMGAFMMMGLLGVIIASVINWFLMSPALMWVVSMASVVIFTGLTAYDTQSIKQSYAESSGTETNDKLAIWGALRLYLDFLNIFLSLLRLFGNSRN